MIPFIWQIFNDIDVQLYGTNKILIGFQSIVSFFIDKLEQLRYNLSKMDFYPDLSSIKEEITPEDIDRFPNHLNKHKLDMEKRFEDSLKLNVMIG
ncbi:hypothetical protein CDAR_311451 [Caerostris darwini]|uniref:Uncharacterized protein n=1 Tax=Caerostris darwini TaxID=1538125 RepID=A0AAV4UTC0_9ARAC|nr:hypothetical protein CDAR_311451 [Caerostris darwini]